MKNLTPKQIDVIFEAVDFVKRENKEYIPMLKEFLVYNHDRPGAAQELLKENFDEIVRVEGLTEEEKSELRGICNEDDDDFE